MSHFTINGRPAGYYVGVVERHAELCAAAVAAGMLTADQAAELKRDVPGVDGPASPGAADAAVVGSEHGEGIPD